MIRNEHRAFFTRLPLGRVGFRWGSKQIASRSGAGAARKRQYQGTGAFDAAVVFSPQARRSKESAISSPSRRTASPFCGGRSLKWIRVLQSK
jgi:hypothetical protein